MPNKAQFLALGRAQRVKPEIAMRQAIHALGGGVLSFVLEHAGDLMHRANDPGTFDSAGYEYVSNKVMKTLRTLRQSYGFRREHETNMNNNANRWKDTKYYEKVEKALKAYASAHAKLKTYNQAQRIMRDICIALGESRFEDATAGLGELDSHLGSEQEWVSYAHEGLQ